MAHRSTDEDFQEHAAWPHDWILKHYSPPSDAIYNQTIIRMSKALLDGGQVDLGSLYRIQRDHGPQTVHYGQLYKIETYWKVYEDFKSPRLVLHFNVDGAFKLHYNPDYLNNHITNSLPIDEGPARLHEIWKLPIS